jgi:hypothetical protein
VRQSTRSLLEWLERRYSPIAEREEVSNICLDFTPSTVRLQQRCSL